MKAYSKEMRRDVLAACDAGEGTKAVALRFDVSESWVRRVKQERREQGKTAPCTTRRRIPKWHRYRERIEQYVKEYPDATLQEIKEATEFDLSLATLCGALRRMKLTLKKSPDRGRTRSTGRRRASRRVDAHAGGARSRQARFPRRNMGEDEHDPSARPGADR